MEIFVPKDCEGLRKFVHGCIERLGPNCDLNFIDVSKLTDLSGVFAYPNHKFNGDISRWNDSRVEDMSELFFGCEFNGDISRWEEIVHLVELKLFRII